MALLLTTTGCNSTAREGGTGAYPTGPISLVIPYAAGGGSDLVATILVDAIAEETGAEIRTVNMPGGGGSVAMNHVLDAKPDGLTIGISDPGPTIALPLTQDLNYTPEDIDHLGRVTQYGFAILVQEDGPYENLEDLVEAADAAPGEITYASSGPVAVDAIGAKLLASASDAEFRGVPYEGSGETTLAVLSGDVDFSVPSQPAAIEAQGHQDLKLLATTLPETAENPFEKEGVPIAAEAGVDFSWESFRGLMAPQGVPENVTEFWDKTFTSLAENEELAQRLHDIGEEFSPLGPADQERYFTELESELNPIVKKIQ